jgi:hypothetical protein
MAELDIKEGVSVKAYLRETMALLDADGLEVNAEVYRVVDPVPFATPSSKGLGIYQNTVYNIFIPLNEGEHEDIDYRKEWYKARDH